MYKLCVFIPLSHAELVKQAMFDAGGGRIGNYDYCSFELEGLGQFRPLKGSRPYLGKENKVEKVKELRVELVVANESIKGVVEAMKRVHPYETPAYDVIRLEDL